MTGEMGGLIASLRRVCLTLVAIAETRLELLLWRATPRLRALPEH